MSQAWSVFSMQNRYYHFAQIGTFELKFCGRDDRYVKRAVARWLSLFWEKAKTRQRKKYPNSIAVSIDDGWYELPMIKIGRWFLGSGDVIPCSKPAILEFFPASQEAIKEFCRVFARR